MPQIDVDPATYESLMLSASLLDVQPGEVVAQLIARSAAGRGNRSSVVSTDDAPLKPARDAVTSSVWLPIHKVFKGERVAGAFNPATSEVRVTSIPWNGKIFSSPTAAAQAVVTHLSGDRVTPNTNGRKFWRLDDGRGDLRVIIGSRF